MAAKWHLGKPGILSHHVSAVESGPLRDVYEPNSVITLRPSTAEACWVSPCCYRCPLYENGQTRIRCILKVVVPHPFLVNNGRA